MSRFDVTALGEPLLRLSVPAGRPLETATALDLHLGGSEANVCAALAGLGRRTALYTRVPTGPLGRFVLRTLRAAGVDTSGVALADGTRLGTYYTLFAAPPCPVEVIYDRAGSAFTGLTVDMIDWDVLLDTRVLHLTGITPALGPGCSGLVLEAAQRAKAKGVTVSFDVNYRSKLWSPEGARANLSALLPLVDLLICGEADARTVFGLQAGLHVGRSGDEREVLAALHNLSGAAHVVLTRAHEGAVTLLEGELVRVPAREATVLDRLGAGDAFAAGVLDGFLEDDLVTGLERGAALSALVLGQQGDLLTTTRGELEAVLNGSAVRLNR